MYYTRPQVLLRQTPSPLRCGASLPSSGNGRRSSCARAGTGTKAVRRQAFHDLCLLEDHKTKESKNRQEVSGNWR